jgi:hypothetical protein
MTSIALAIFILFIVYVMVWSIKNDGAASIGEQTGFIRMLDPSRKAADAAKAPQRSSRSPSSHPHRPAGKR